MNRLVSAQTTALVAMLALLTACTDDPETTTADDTPTASASPADWTPVPEDSDEILPAGRYGLTVAENVLPDLPWAVVDTPDGFGHFFNWILADEGPAGGGAVSYWTLHAVYQDPCASQDVKVVETVEEAATAFQAQRGSKVSVPRPVTLDGYRGLYLELEIPETTNFAACPEYHPWDIDAAGGLPYVQGPGTERLWILDIDGDLAVIDASEDAETPEAASQQLTTMVESIDFVARS